MTCDDRPLIFLGVDIGKSAHYAVAVDRDGQTVYSKPVANEESALRLLVLWARAHQAVVIVDQPGGTAAVLLKLCWDATIGLGYVSGLAMARARDFYAGDSKTDPKDAFVLADIARAHPGRVVWLPSGLATRNECGPRPVGAPEQLRWRSTWRCESSDEPHASAAGLILARPR